MIRNLKQVLFLLVLTSAALLFLSQPFRLLTSAEDDFPRWLFFLLPLADPGFLITQIWGETGVHFFDPDRFKIIGIGLLILAALWETGFLLLKLPKNISSRLNGIERSFFAFLLGMAVVSLSLSWLGFFGILGKTVTIPLCLLALGGLIHFFWSLFRFPYSGLNLKFTGTEIVFGILILLFVFIYLLAGTIPPFEYDMLEYHAQGAREIAETGRIGFFEHNVYLNMPLGSEMIYTAGILMNPFRGENGADQLLIGVTAGKFVLSFLPLITALGSAAFLKRAVQSGSCGNLLTLSAVLAFLAFPELFQVSANGLIDTVPALFLIGTLYFLYLTLQSDKKKDQTGILLFSLLTGFSAGFAAGCKYTSIPFILIPAACVFLFWFRLRTKLGFGLFCLGAFFGGGGWYLKNLVFTGNPLYPLAYRIFGDRTGFWNQALNLRWHKAHSADSFSCSAFFADLSRLVTDDFASMIFAVFALLIFLVFIRSFSAKKGRLFPILTIFSISFFILWWFATHRFLRFLVPVLPVAGILLALVWTEFRNSANLKPIRGMFDLLLAAGAVYALSLDLTAVSGFLTPISAIAEDADRYGEISVQINQKPALVNDSDFPKKLLLIGEARAFAYRSVPVLYNTCWNRSRLASLLPNPEKYRHGSWNWTEPEIAEIKKRFKDAEIGAVLVDENEIRRFLSPGNYGITDEELADPTLFKSLEKAGILKEEKISEQVKFYRVITENPGTK